VRSEREWLMTELLDSIRGQIENVVRDEVALLRVSRSVGCRRSTAIVLASSNPS